MPVNIDRMQSLLTKVNYNKDKTEFLIDGFRNGFDLGYRGKITGIQKTAPNLKLRVGNQTILWNKVMKEVKVKRYAGPFKQIPFEDYIQSPIGLVPKDSGRDVRLIFHLSYPKDGDSVNSQTLKELSSVQYPSFDDVVHRCLEEIKFTESLPDSTKPVLKNIFVGKSDMRSAFRNLGIRPDQTKFLVMMAKSPIDGRTYYFVDKCMPFGAAISCSHFQEFSNAVAFIVKTKTGKWAINYLDDYLFVASLKIWCDNQIRMFLEICQDINFPVSMEKTVWGDTIVIFLGLLIDPKNKLICVPMEKLHRAIILISELLQAKKNKVTSHCQTNPKALQISQLLRKSNCPWKGIHKEAL